MTPTPYGGKQKLIRENTGLEVKGFTQNLTNYLRAGIRTYFSASAYFAQTDVCYKCIMDLLKAKLYKTYENY